MNSSSHKPGEMPAPESIHEFTAASEGTPSPQSQMPTSNMSDIKVIDETDILIKNQHVCSDDISQNMLNTEK
ncbi:hypothetical protein PAAG_12011 [Paracoccidioides lutzii Pb01]|uniref:Uncharacterized protein n=1 Tax=Paracoccidioides lutzii (strain ATCC MYA-826 / Pb01) TaxID=502779 RepID=A0A0A2V5A4_PARBA|nr:hypothetical protein PAAG_12011 [Paracoccidioides lutzii Pb01]KGQ01330.1 hypothetical protein PAAG_12011 [Paracoccidioides lutzii Pb01]